MADRPARLVTGGRRSLVTALCWTVIAVTSGWMVLQLAGGHVGRWTTSAQAITPWVAPWAIVAAVVAAAIGRRAAALAGTVVGATFLALVVPLAFPSGLPAAADDGVLTVTHANLLYSNPRIDDVIDVMLATDADILAFSELTPAFTEAIAASPIGERYPYTVLRSGDAAIGLGLWSRVPITDRDPVPGTTMTITADVDVGGEPMRLVLAHPLPPLFQATHWRSEIRALEAVDADVWARTVLVGDLNVSYFHPPFRRFLDRTATRDVHTALDRGFSVSWPTDEWFPPFVRLDHALVGSRVTATSIEDHTVPGGDHRAFTVSVAWSAGS